METVHTRTMFLYNTTRSNIYVQENHYVFADASQLAD
jgi:hypothetical protein